MATYCTADDVRAALTPGSGKNDGETAASLSEWQILDAVDEAEDVVNAYLQAYEIITVLVSSASGIEGDPNADNTPYEAAPNPVRRWTRSIAAYYASLTYRKNKDLPEDDPVRLRYNAVMALLALVKSGEMVLNLPKDPEAATNQVEVFNLYDGTLFDPRDFKLGPDQQHVQVFIPGTSWGL